MLVLDANILMRAVLGKGARALLARYGARIEIMGTSTRFRERNASQHCLAIPSIPWSEEDVGKRRSVTARLAEVISLGDRVCLVTTRSAGGPSVGGGSDRRGDPADSLTFVDLDVSRSNLGEVLQTAHGHVSG